MSERGSEKEAVQNNSDDVATLYSWANLHGAKYRDFSASRQEMRAQARHRMVEQPVVDPAAEPAQGSTAAQGGPASAETSIPPESSITEMSTADSKVAAPKAAFREAVVDYVKMPAAHAAPVAAVAPVQLPTPAPATAPEPVVNDLSEAPRTMPVDAFAMAPEPPTRESSANPWQDLRSSARRPQPFDTPNFAGQTPSQVPQPGPSYAPRQQSNSRWYALQGFLDRTGHEDRQTAEPRERRIPALAVFSLAGGVGKTSLVATLGRALSAQGEQVLLADTSTYGMLPFYFGSREVRPGLVRKFSPSDGSPDAAVQLVTVDTDKQVPDHEETWIAEELRRDARGSSRILIDLTTASGSLTRRVLSMLPTVLVPVVPDMNSVVSLSAVEHFFSKHLDAAGRPIQPFYVLNKFESSLPLHLDLREMLHEQLGERLLPFVIRRSPDMGEALAEGMTVMDYAPESPIADDYRNLAGWMRSVAAPVSLGFRGVRWSER